MMTTTKRISLLIAGYVTIVMIVFGMIVNIAFFVSWYRLVSQSPLPPAQQDIQTNDKALRIQQPQWYNRMIRRPSMIGSKPLILTDIQSVQQLGQRHNRLNLINYRDQVWHYRIQENRAILTLVDPLIDSQMILIYITLIAAFILALISYIVSMWIVRRGLRPLYALTEHIHHTQDPITYKHLVVGPDHDELQEVSNALTRAMNTIAGYISSLKDFVTQASHELKTPLMTISSSVDVMKRGGIDTSHTKAIKTTTTAMQQLIDKMIASMRHDLLQLQRIDCLQLVEQVVLATDKLFPHCTDSIRIESQRGVVKMTDPVLFESIVSNLINNACKYGVQGSLINIVITDDNLLVSNDIEPGSTINLDQIWQAFYQGDGSLTDINSHGLGLSIVQQYVKRLGWSIKVQREDNTIIFTIDWS